MTFSKRISQRIDSFLEPYGFKRNKYNNYLNESHAEIIQIIGFGFSGPPTQKYISSIIGVTHKQVEELWAEIDKRSPDFTSLVLGGNIGYYTPQKTYLEWKFQEDNTFEDTFKSMTDTIIEYGFPFLEEMRKENEFFHTLLEEKHLTGGRLRGEILPILFYLQGRMPLAIKWIEEELNRHLHSMPSSQIEFNKGYQSYSLFARRFMELHVSSDISIK